MIRREIDIWLGLNKRKPKGYSGYASSVREAIEIMSEYESMYHAINDLADTKISFVISKDDKYMAEDLIDKLNSMNRMYDVFTDEPSQSEIKGRWLYILMLGILIFSFILMGVCCVDFLT